MANDPLWIEHANLHRGKFTAYAKRNHEPMSSAIKKGEKSKSGTLRHEAELAATFRHIRTIRERGTHHGKIHHNIKES